VLLRRKTPSMMPSAISKAVFSSRVATANFEGHRDASEIPIKQLTVSAGCKYRQETGTDRTIRYTAATLSISVILTIPWTKPTLIYIILS
jgi:hypothetical protein